MATAGYQGDIEVSADDSTYNSVGGINTVGFNMGRAQLEVTEFGDDFIDRISGLFDTPVTLGGHRIHADAGQAALVAAFLAGSDIWVRWKPDGTNGFKVKCGVADMPLGNGVGDAAQVSFTLASRGKPAAV
jgi:hypothetical protein